MLNIIRGFPIFSSDKRRQKTQRKRTKRRLQKKILNTKNFSLDSSFHLISFYSSSSPPSDEEDTQKNTFDLNFWGKIDTIYKKSGPKPFQFNREVVWVFDDMISGILPLYYEVTNLILCWLEKCYIAGTRVYDFGCSTETMLNILTKVAKLLSSSSSICYNVYLSFKDKIFFNI